MSMGFGLIEGRAVRWLIFYVLVGFDLFSTGDKRG